MERLHNTLSCKNAEILEIISQVLLELASVFPPYLEASLDNHRNNWNVHFISFDVRPGLTVENRSYGSNWYIIRFRLKHVKTLVNDESKTMKKIIKNLVVWNTYNSHIVD